MHGAGCTVGEEYISNVLHYLVKVLCYIFKVHLKCTSLLGKSTFLRLYIVTTIFVK